MIASLKEKAVAFTCSREFQNLGAGVLIVSWTCLLPENVSEMDSQIQWTRVSWGWSPTAQVLVSSPSELNKRSTLWVLVLSTAENPNSCWGGKVSSQRGITLPMVSGTTAPEKEQRSQATREFWKTQGLMMASDKTEFYRDSNFPGTITERKGQYGSIRDTEILNLRPCDQ